MLKSRPYPKQWSKKKKPQENWIKQTGKHVCDLFSISKIWIHKYIINALTLECSWMSERSIDIISSLFDDLNIVCSPNTG